MQRTLELHYDKLVIGADLSALSFAYINKIPILYIRKLIPHEYCILENTEKRIDLYGKLFFLLSIANYNPFADLLQTIRIEDHKTLKLITKNNLIIKVTFNSLIISDDYEVSGLPPVKETTTKDSCVVDWFNIACGAVHDIDQISTNDDLARTIKFYISKRCLYKNKTKKDCLTISKINSDLVDSFDYSPLIVSFKTKKEMKEKGLRGKWDKTNNKFKPIKLVSTKREVHHLWKNLYDGLPENISILIDDYEKILNEQQVTNEHVDFLKKQYAINI